MRSLIAAAFVFGVFAAQGFAQNPIKVIVYPEEAIADSAMMTHGQFKKAYPGIDVTNFGLTDEGYYIRYAHEKLIYMFGPFLDLDQARMQKKRLEEIRLSLVLKAPKLSSSRIDIVRFDFGAALGQEQTTPQP